MYNDCCYNAWCAQVNKSHTKEIIIMVKGIMVIFKNDLS